ncbi:MAG: BMP family protein [Micrococcales bacterium]
MLKQLIGALVSVAVLTGCSQLEKDATPTPVDYMGCVLSDNFGLDDQSVGSLTFLGALQAQAQFGIKLRQVSVSANATYSDYETALATAMDFNCDMVVAVGGAAEVIEKNAAQYPNTNFVEVHGRPYSLGEASGLSAAELSNVKSLSYDSAQGSFLAGYLAATQSETKVVAGFADTLNRAELAMLAGFSQGVAYANAKNQTNVVILGQATSLSDYWLTMGQANPAETETAIKDFIRQGADIIVPVVGSTQQTGAASRAVEAVSLSGQKVSIIGTFANWYAGESVSETKSAVLASVLLNIQRDVSEAIGADLDGTFNAGLTGEYLGTLANQGVELVGPHDIAFNQDFSNQIETLKTAIASGQIVITSRLQ